ncbi:MAG TPA: HAMP domain-containing sensor histidine kinase [Candidatus Binatia bacterium]|nr:HAMP domain-containing sensor histidine kinase [Candidatus Binatia bacterium]
MKISTRLTLWYSALLMASLIIMAGVLHYEWTEQRDLLLRQQQPPETVWEEVGEVILFYGLPTAVLLLIGGVIFIRKALRPVATLSHGAERIHAGNLAEQLPRSGNGDELDRLTGVFNDMTGRLHQAFLSIREFTLHASHELRTPLTVMHAELETALNQETLSPAERERISNLLDEVQRLAQIVDGLSFLTKADSGMLKFSGEPVQFDDLVRDGYADAQILGGSKKVHVQLNVCAPVTVKGDRHRLRQLLLILTDNAIKYNHQGGEVALSLEMKNGTALLTISNSGPGIPAATADRVFERFFRGDPSHSQAIEGSGLGLSIAQGIVHAHNGKIRIHSESEYLTTVTVELPRIELNQQDGLAPG